jgi:hypothetical protein
VTPTKVSIVIDFKLVLDATLIHIQNLV